MPLGIWIAKGNAGLSKNYPSRVAAERVLLGAWRRAWAAGWRPEVGVKT